MEEKKLLRINVEMGAHNAASFDAVHVTGEDGVSYYCRVDEGEMLSTGGMLRIDGNSKRIGIMYDIFTVFTDIKRKIEVDGNLYYVCSNDLFDNIDIFIADREQWVKSGKAIFGVLL